MTIQILAGISLSIGCLIIVSNWYSLYVTRRSGQFISPVPLAGGVLLGICLLGYEQTHSYYWLGIIFDYGTLTLIFAIPNLLWEKWLTSSFNLLHRFHSNMNNRNDVIRLFKNGRFTIRTQYNPPAISDENGALAISSGYEGIWRQESDHYLLEGYDKNRVLKIIKANDLFITEEDNYPEKQKFPYNYLGKLKLNEMV